MGLSLSSATSPWRVQDVEKSRFVLQILYIDLDLAPCHFVSSRPVGTWVGTCCQASWSLFCLSLPLLCLLILPPTKIPFSSRNSRIGKLHMIERILARVWKRDARAGRIAIRKATCLFVSRMGDGDAWRSHLGHSCPCGDDDVARVRCCRSLRCTLHFLPSGCCFCCSRPTHTILRYRLCCWPRPTTLPLVSKS